MLGRRAFRPLLLMHNILGRGLTASVMAQRQQKSNAYSRGEVDPSHEAERHATSIGLSTIVDVVTHLWRVSTSIVIGILLILGCSG